MKKKKVVIAFLLFVFLSLTGCTKYYVNNQKSTETTIVPGSEEYLNRIMSTIYNDDRFDVKEKEIVMITENTTLDNEHYFYYVYSNNNIIRVSENYDFVYYDNCTYWNLIDTMPTITSYDSAYKYTIVPQSKWYFVYYGVGEGVVFENEAEVVDESMFDNYKINWIAKCDTAEDFVKIRFFHYYYVKYIDEVLKNGENLVLNYDYIKGIYSFNIITAYDQELLDNLDSMLFYAYYENGRDFADWLKFKIGAENYDEIVASIDYNADFEAISNYFANITIVDNMFTIDGENPSSVKSELDDKLRLPAYDYSMDFNVTSLYNNYNSNNDIVVYVDENDDENTFNSEDNVEENENEESTDDFTININNYNPADFDGEDNVSSTNDLEEDDTSETNGVDYSPEDDEDISFVEQADLNRRSSQNE